jgi:hypothetical protein
MFNKIFKFFQKPKKVAPNENPELMVEKIYKSDIGIIDESIPRTEILAEGFVYEYPYTKDGGRVLPDNIRKAAKFYLAAKTDQEMAKRAQLLSQVSDLEAKLATDSIVERINREVKEKQKMNI